MTKLDNFKFQARLKLTFENLGFLVVAILGTAGGIYQVAHTLL